MLQYERVNLGEIVQGKFLKQVDFYIKSVMELQTDDPSDPPSFEVKMRRLEK